MEAYEEGGGVMGYVIEFSFDELKPLSLDSHFGDLFYERHMELFRCSNYGQECSCGVTYNVKSWGKRCPLCGCSNIDVTVEAWNYEKEVWEKLEL